MTTAKPFTGVVCVDGGGALLDFAEASSSSVAWVEGQSSKNIHQRGREREREIKREGERHIGFFNSNVGNIMRNRNLNVYMNIFLKHDAAMLLVESLHPKLCCRWGRNIIVLYSVKVM